MVSVLPPGIDVRKLQRSHSELTRVEPLWAIPASLTLHFEKKLTFKTSQKNILYTNLNY